MTDGPPLPPDPAPAEPAPPGPALEPVPRDPHVVPARYLTDDLPGIGGTIRDRAEDFLVEEIPLYDPAGEGEHVYMMVQKAGLSTFQMIDIVARSLRVPRGAIGYAGLKDKHAITRQVISVHLPGRDETTLPPLQHPRLAVLWVDRHLNKLRRGHLRGNRFSVRIRGVQPSAAIPARRVLERLSRLGMPNRLGEQRFGHAQNNHLIGRALLLGDARAACDELLLPPGDTRPEHAEQRRAYAQGRYADAAALMPPGAETELAVLSALARGHPPQRAIQAMEPAQAMFFLTAFQSAVFNAVLDARLADGTWDRLVEGDLACKLDNHAVFAVDAATLADPQTPARLAALAIAPSGPMWGGRMPRACGTVDALELSALGATGVTPEAIERFNESTRLEPLKGDRRALRVPVIDPQIEGGADEHGPYVKVIFELPAGSFATVPLREIMKPERAAPPTPVAEQASASPAAAPGPGPAPDADATPPALPRRLELI